MSKNEAQRDKRGKRSKEKIKIYRGYSEKAQNIRGCSPRKGVAEFILRGTMTKKFITLKKNIKAQIKKSYKLPRG